MLEKDARKKYCPMNMGCRSSDDMSVPSYCWANECMAWIDTSSSEVHGENTHGECGMATQRRIK